MDALLIIDMSNDFVDDKGGLSVKGPAQAIVPAIIKSANETLEGGGIVVVCMDEHLNGKDHSWPNHNEPGTWGAQLYSPLKTWWENIAIIKFPSQVYYIPKQSYNAFHDTELGRTLRDLDIKTVKLTGVCTDICVFNTGCGAFDESLEIIVPRSCVATFSQFGETALQMMALQFNAKIVD